jgi:hypothetical protein
MWELRQYRSVVDDFLESCGEHMEAAILQRLEQLQIRGSMARPPLSKKLSGTDGLFECRCRAGKAQSRLLYFFHSERRIVFVVAVHKAQRKLDRGAIRTAHVRKRSVITGIEPAHGIDYNH